MKNLFTALVAVFFMFAVNGCSDDADCDTPTQSVDVENSAPEDGTPSEADVVDSTDDADSVEVSDTSAVETEANADTTEDSGDDAADEQEGE